MSPGTQPGALPTHQVSCYKGEAKGRSPGKDECGTGRRARSAVRRTNSDSALARPATLGWGGGTSRPLRAPCSGSRKVGARRAQPPSMEQRRGRMEPRPSHRGTDPSLRFVAGKCSAMWNLDILLHSARIILPPPPAPTAWFPLILLLEATGIYRPQKSPFQPTFKDYIDS